MVRPSTGCSFHSNAHLRMMMIKGDMIAWLWGRGTLFAKTFAKYEEKNWCLGWQGFIHSHIIPRGWRRWLQGQTRPPPGRAGNRGTRKPGFRERSWKKIENTLSAPAFHLHVEWLGNCYRLLFWSLFCFWIWRRMAPSKDTALVGACKQVELRDVLCNCKQPLNFGGQGFL